MAEVYSSSKLKGSVQKVNLVANLIRGKRVFEAISLLSFVKRRRVALDIRKVLFSAISNAQNNNNMDVDALFISRILIGKTQSFKRFRARAKGRSNRICKHYSNIKIFLDEVL